MLLGAGSFRKGFLLGGVKARRLSLIALFTALYYVLPLLPGIPVVGFPQVKIEVEAAFASVFWVIFGPVIRIIHVLIAASVGVPLVRSLKASGLMPLEKEGIFHSSLRREVFVGLELSNGKLL